ncbi:MAG: hypothetical protein F6J86_08060 [Symploca sp. SIO1B1]|nr:hypothetical protein [Symploca sp. SIO1B1]
MYSSEPSTGENSLNPQLVSRLASPLLQPGIANHDMATDIVERSQSFANRLPLLDQQMQRWMSIAELRSHSVPIVYATPYMERRGDGETRGWRDAGTRRGGDGNSDNLFPLPLASTSSIDSADLPLVQAKLENNNSYESTTPIPSIPATELPVSSPVAPNEVVEVVTNQPLASTSSIDSADLPLVQAKLENNNSYESTTPIPSIPATELPVSSPVAPNEVVEVVTNQPLASTSSIDSADLPLVQAKLENNNSYESTTPIPYIPATELPTSSPVAPNEAGTANSKFKIQNSKLIDSADLPLVQGKLETSNTKSLSVVAPSSSPRPRVPASLHPRVTPSPRQIQRQEERLPVVQPVSDLLPYQLQTLVYSTVAIAQSSPRIPAQGKSLTPQPVTTNNQAFSQSPITSQAYTNVSESSPPHSSNTPVTSAAMPPPTMDINTVAAQVERKLRRRLVIESERRGKKRWR